MQHRVSLGWALMVCAAAQAVEPAAGVPATSPSSAPHPAVAAPDPRVRKPLDLRVGDVRRYMMPNEFRAAIDAPDADKNTVVVEGNRELLPVKYERPIPPGAIMAPIWALMNPTQSWRILLPDINRPPPGPPDRVPPPIFRWGP